MANECELIKNEIVDFDLRDILFQSLSSTVKYQSLLGSLVQLGQVGLDNGVDLLQPFIDVNLGRNLLEHVQKSLDVAILGIGLRNSLHSLPGIPRFLC